MKGPDYSLFCHARNNRSKRLKSPVLGGGIFGVILFLLASVGIAFASTDKEEIFKSALAEYNDGNFGKAKALLDGIPVEDLSELPEAERLLGVLLLQDGRLEQAVVHFESAWENGSDKALFPAAITMIKLNRLKWLDENRGALKRELARDPKILNVYLSWFGQRWDLSILEEGLSKVKDESILADDQSLLNTLTVFRHVINTVGPDGQKREE